MRHIRSAIPIAAALAAAACERSPSGAGPLGCGGEPLRLSAGEVAELRPGGAVCAFAPAAGAEYALVYLDTHPSSAEAAPSEPFARENVKYGVTVADAGGAAGFQLAPQRSMETSAAAPDDVGEQALAPSAATFYDRLVPWAVGDTVMTPGCPPDAPSCGGEPSRVARVARVYDGWMVLAVMQGDPHAARIVAQVDAAYPLVRDHGVPMMNAVFGAARPVTSGASGQYLVVAGTRPDTRPSRSISVAAGDAVRAWMEIWLGDEEVDHPRIVSLLAHEMAHAYQRAWSHASRSPGVAQSQTGTSRWGVEGGANLMSYEVVRRIAGAPLAGNYDWRNPGTDPFRAFYAFRAQSGSGDVTGGYDGTMPFLRDLVVRRVQKGEPVETALREVSRGAIEGWWGGDALGSTRPGLVARMRGALGSAWNPADGLLTWALSVVGDDRNGSTIYQDAASLRVWDVRPGEYGWHADGTLRAGSGATIAASRPYGSPGYSYLADAGSGIRVRLGSSQPEGTVRWMVMRVK